MTRAVLETLPSPYACVVALWSQRAAVKSRHTQQRFVLWLRRLHELANPWKRFKCVMMFLNPCLAKFWSQPFPLLCCVVSRLCERPWFSVSARGVVGPDSARSIVAQIEKCSQALRYSFNPCFQPARVILVCFFCSVVEVRCACFAHASHMMSQRTWPQGP